MFARGLRNFRRSLPSVEQIRAWAEVRRWEQADAAIRVHMERQPQDGAVLMLAARIAAGQGQLERCADLLQRIPATSSNKPEAMLRQGQALRDAGLLSRAESIWRDALSRPLDPAAPQFTQAIRAELVSLFSLERRAPEARKLLWEMYPGHSEKWRLLIALARLDGRGSNPQVALELLDRLVPRESSNDIEVRLGRARYLSELGRWTEAKAEIDHCREQSPTHPRALELALLVSAGLQDWDALDQLLANCAIDQFNSTIWRVQALRYKTAGDWEKSETCFVEALKLGPADPITHYQFAQLLLMQGDRQRAEWHHEAFRQIDTHQKALEQYLSSIVHTDPQNWSRPDPEHCVELSEHVRVLGHLDEAREWLCEAIRQKPIFPEADLALKQLADADR